MNRGNLQVFALRITTKRPRVAIGDQTALQNEPLSLSFGWVQKQKHRYESSRYTLEATQRPLLPRKHVKQSNIFSRSLHFSIASRRFRVLNCSFPTAWDKGEIVWCAEPSGDSLRRGGRFNAWSSLGSLAWNTGMLRGTMLIHWILENKLSISNRDGSSHPLERASETCTRIGLDSPCRGDSPHTLPCKATTWTFNTVARTDHNCTASIPSARGNASSYTLEPKLLVEHKAHRPCLVPYAP